MSARNWVRSLSVAGLSGSAPPCLVEGYRLDLGEVGERIHRVRSAECSWPCKKAVVISAMKVSHAKVEAKDISVVRPSRVSVGLVESTSPASARGLQDAPRGGLVLVGELPDIVREERPKLLPLGLGKGNPVGHIQDAFVEVLRILLSLLLGARIGGCTGGGSVESGLGLFPVAREDLERSLSCPDHLSPQRASWTSTGPGGDVVLALSLCPWMC